MQTNTNVTRKPEPLKPRTSTVKSGGEIKKKRKVHTRKIPYRVGYTWNKGGRLKELRIRHLARKFLKIWMQNTFGHIHPHKARLHHERVVLLKAFEAWRDEWWTSRKEWSLTVRAECHHRYHLYNWPFHSWQRFVSSQREKKKKVQIAQSFAEGQRMRLAWERWEVFLEMRRMKRRMLESAIEQKRLSTLRLVWHLWQAKLQQCHDFNTLEDQALDHWALTLQSRVWLQWKEMHTVVCTQRERESKASLHFLLGVKRRALQRWTTYVTLCREDAERGQIASQHHSHHSLRAGLRGLSLHVSRSKAQRLNKHMAVQHCRQTMTSKYWRLWQDRLEEAEDKDHHPQIEMALTNYSASLLSSCFQYWRERLAERRYIQGLEHRAEAWFAEHMLPQCFNSWVEFTLQRRLHKKRREKAEVYHQQHLYTRTFYTWWEESEKHKEQMLCGRLAILHEERCCVQRAWARWRQRTEQQIAEEEKRRASDSLYLHRLLHNTVTQWKDSSTEMRDRRNREEQACHQGDLHRMRWATDRWKKFVQSQKVKNNRLEQMQHYHEVKLLQHAVEAWKKRHRQMAQTCAHAEELYRLKQQCNLRQALLAWREAAMHAMAKRHQQGEILTRAQSCITQVSLQGTFRHWRMKTREALRERTATETATQHYRSKVLSRTLKAWKRHHCQYQKYEVMKQQGMVLLRWKACQRYFERWKMELQHRREEAEQTELALWHWSLTLQAKVVYAWRLWLWDQHRKRERLAGAALFYRDQLLREGVAHILTHATHMSGLTASLTQHSQEQSSRRLQMVVRRCAMRWKQRALGKANRAQEVRDLPSRKSVTFCLPPRGSESASHGVSRSGPAEQQAAYGALSELVHTRAARLQPRRCKELLNSPVLQHKGTQRQSLAISADTKNQLGGHQQSHLHPTEPASLLHSVRLRLQPAPVPFSSSRPPSVTQSTSVSAAVHSQPHTPSVSAAVHSQPHTPSAHALQSQDVLLPPSAFSSTNAPTKLAQTSNSSPGHAALVHQFSSPFEHHSPSFPASREEVEAPDVEADPTSELTRELLGIRLDMESFQHDRQQIRLWQRLKEVLNTWLQTSGKEDQMEKDIVCQELKELEENINRLSAELEERKPTMLLHAERVQRLQSLLLASGVASLRRPAEEKETGGHSVFTT